MRDQPLPRKITIKLYEAVDEGRLEWETIAKEALGYMSEDDVADMTNVTRWLGEDND